MPSTSLPCARRKRPSDLNSLIAWRTVPKGIVGGGDRDCALSPKMLAKPPLSRLQGSVH